MADYDAKSATPDSSIDDTNGGVIGFDNQADATPKVFLYSVIKTWIKSWIVKADVGLGNASNTSDANKPVSTAQQTALDLKADLSSPTLTGTPAAPTAAPGTNTTQLATTGFVKAAIDVVLGGVSAAFDTLSEIATALALKANIASPTFTGTVAGITSAMVGLGNVLNSVQLVAASNLSDVANVTIARNNLSAAPTRHSGYVSARWYFPPGVGPASGGTNTTNTIVAFPFIAPAAITITDLAIRVQTLQAAKLISLAIYAGNISTCRPTGNPLSSTSSNISFGTGGNASNALSANVTLVPGNLYWLAFNTDASTGICGGIGNAGPEIPGLLGGALADLWNGGSVVSITGVSTAQTFGTWPDLTAASFTVLTSAAVPMIAFKAQ